MRNKAATMQQAAIAGFNVCSLEFQQKCRSEHGEFNFVGTMASPLFALNKQRCTGTALSFSQTRIKQCYLNS